MKKQPQNNTAETQPTRKKRNSLVGVLLAVFIVLFLLTSAVLGARLYERATRDRYSVDLGMGMDGEVELFKIEYSNASGEITVQGTNGQSVIAPGTAVNYDVRLRNRDDVVIDFVMLPQIRFLSDDQIPIRFRLMDSYGNYLLGSDTQWVDAENVNGLAHRGQIHPGEIFTYHLEWEWIFESNDSQDQHDTQLGNQNSGVLPGVEVSIETQSTANPNVQTHTPHNMHLWGENFGCCWCCYLMWGLLLICVLLLISVWRMKKRFRKQEEMLELYEQAILANGIEIER